MNKDTKQLLKARAHVQRALQLNDELSFGVNLSSLWPSGWWPDGSGYTSTPAPSIPAPSRPVVPKDYKIAFHGMTIDEVEKNGIMHPRLGGCIIRTPQSECSLRHELRKIADEECIWRNKCKSAKDKKCDDYLQLPCKCYVHKNCFRDFNQMNETIEGRYVEFRILNDWFTCAKLTCTSCEKDNTYRLLIKENVLQLPLVEHNYKHTPLSSEQNERFKRYKDIEDGERKKREREERERQEQTKDSNTASPPQKPHRPEESTSQRSSSPFPPPKRTPAPHKTAAPQKPHRPEESTSQRSSSPFPPPKRTPAPQKTAAPQKTPDPQKTPAPQKTPTLKESTSQRSHSPLTRREMIKRGLN